MLPLRYIPGQGMMRAQPGQVATEDRMVSVSFDVLQANVFKTGSSTRSCQDSFTFETKWINQHKT